MSSMQSVAATAAIGQEPVTRQLTVAITGDACSDLMAAIRRVADDSGLSARQVQYIFECYAKLYKDAADQNDRASAQHSALIKQHQDRVMAERVEPMHVPPTFPWQTTSGGAGLPAYDLSSGTDQTAFEELKRKVIQSGTHSPSTIRPDSVGGSVEPRPPLDPFLKPEDSEAVSGPEQAGNPAAAIAAAPS